MEKLRSRLKKYNKYLADNDLKVLYRIIKKIVNETNTKDEELIINWVAANYPVFSEEGRV